MGKRYSTRLCLIVFFLSYQILTRNSLCYSEAGLIKYSHYVTISRNNFNLKTFLILTHEGNLKDSLMKNKGSMLKCLLFLSTKTARRSLLVKSNHSTQQLSNFFFPTEFFSNRFLSFFFVFFDIYLLDQSNFSFLLSFVFISFRVSILIVGLFLFILGHFVLYFDESFGICELFSLL